MSPNVQAVQVKKVMDHILKVMLRKTHLFHILAITKKALTHLQAQITREPLLSAGE